MSTESRPKEGVKVDEDTPSTCWCGKPQGYINWSRGVKNYLCSEHAGWDGHDFTGEVDLGPRLKPVKEFIDMQSELNVGGGRISAVAAELMDTLIKKNADYAGGQEFFNFEQAAEFAGLDAFYVMLAQIGIKYTRIANLHGGDMPQNESLRDSLVDLAGYAVIAAAWLDAVQGEE